MFLGILADIHEANVLLREALDEFSRRGVEEIIFLGDVCAMHQHLEETIGLMREARVASIWGNHDYGMCQGVDSHMRKRYSPELFGYTETWTGHLIRDDCLFSHVEPWLDPNDILQLWYFDGMPETKEKLARSFNAVPQRVLFSGHVHRWFLATPEGPIDWDGTSKVTLRPPMRYYLTIDALINGWCATYQTTTGELTPIRLTSPPPERR